MPKSETVAISLKHAIIKKWCGMYPKLHNIHLVIPYSLLNFTLY